MSREGEGQSRRHEWGQGVGPRNRTMSRHRTHGDRGGRRDTKRNASWRLHLASQRRDRVLAYQDGHGRGYLPRVGEPAIVVGDRKELTYLLSQAAELEHGLMCEYLYAAFSLKGSAGPGVRDDQLAAVERWRGMILGIAAEEMLHWAVVQNLLTAVGSAPYVSRPHMPHQAKGYPPGVQLRLLPFGEAALQHFVYLERPEGMEGADAEGFQPAGPPIPPMRPEEIIPRGQEFATVGHLYRSIEHGLALLADKLGEDRLFIGPAFQQADEAAFGWPDLRPITDLAGANRAIERIVEQGEGARGDWANAHYGRFLAVVEQYQAMRDEDPGFEPAYPVVAAARRGVEGIEPEVYISDPTTGACSDLFNAVYELLLQLIARYFAFGHETSRAAPGAGAHRRRPDVPGHQAARAAARPPAGGPGPS